MSSRPPPAQTRRIAHALRAAIVACAALCAACPLDIEGRPCADLDDCVQGYVCTDGKCAQAGDPVACSDVADCPAGFNCAGDVCAARSGDARSVDFSATDLVTIGLSAVGGATRIVGVPSADRVSAVASVTLTANTEARSDEVTFTGDVAGDTLELVAAKPAEAAFEEVAIHVDVRAPPSLAFALRDATNGPVELHGLRGGAVVEPTGEPAGAITGDGLAGPISLITFGQPIDVGVELTADVSLSSQSGDVVARIPAGASMQIGAQSIGGGTVTLQGVTVTGESTSSSAVGFIGSGAAATYTLTISTSGDITISGE